MRKGLAIMSVLWLKLVAWRGELVYLVDISPINCLHAFLPLAQAILRTSFPQRLFLLPQISGLQLLVGLSS